MGWWGIFIVKFLKIVLQSFILDKNSSHAIAGNLKFCKKIFSHYLICLEWSEKFFVFVLEHNSYKKLLRSDTLKNVQNLIKNFKVFRRPQRCKNLIFADFFKILHYRIS